MSIAIAITSTVLAAAITYAAVRKLSHRPEVVAEYARAGVPERWLSPLALILCAAALALVAGLAWTPLGLGAAAGLALYFAVAIAFHVRARDLGNVATPLALEVLAVATTVMSIVDL